ncbi:MAG: cytidylate kinase-like family protein [Muribaculaceae bacterium]|nr:cytidylate kinase-like family protein [Muribaculaceae bacterium]
MAKNSSTNNHCSADSGSTFPDNCVIVIGRQFGSGGRTIGKIIAKRLGFSYYDTELLSEAAAALGVSRQVLEDHDEKKPSALRALLQGAYGIADNFHAVPLTGERIYTAQCSAIKEIVKKGSCVIVGRNADFILRQHPHLLSVFLHSPVELRAQRILQRKEAQNRQEAIDMALRNDRRRESFYNFYTGDKRWGQADNYHLSIDTSSLDNESVADLIIKLASIKFLVTESGKDI